MNSKEVLSKYKPIIIIILLFSAVFLLRAQSVYLSNVSDDFKSYYQDENGLPYFSEMDSYYNYRLTENFINHGSLGDTVINGTQWDLHSYYPQGRSADYPPLIVYITSFIYKLANIVTNVPLTTIAFWMGPIIASLCVIPAYLFVRRITNDFGGITAAILIGTAASYFSHTFAGFFDTDMFNILLPLLVIWFFIESIRADSLKWRSIYAALSVISMLIFSSAWTGWWYVFYLVIAVSVVYLVVSKYIFGMDTFKSPRGYSSKKDWFLDQKVIFSVVIFVLASTILMLISMGPTGLANSLFGPFGFTTIQDAVAGTSYPNVYVSVSELQIPSFSDVRDGAGGIFALIFGILSVPLLIWKLKSKDDNENKAKETAPKIKKKPRRKGRKTKVEPVNEKIERINVKEDPKLGKMKMDYVLYLVLFSLWLLITAYAMTKGSRFIATFSLPIALGAGVSVGLIAPFIGKYIKNVKYCAVVVLLLMAVIAYPAVSGAYAISYSVVPGTDDSMYDSMGWIKNNTSNNTVITSWWDYGHLFAAAADRPVTFDGGSQNSPRAYWVGKALFTSDENLSAGILRMLASSGDLGYLTLENYTKDTGKSVEILTKTLPVDKENARTIMVNDYKLTTTQADNVLKYTHPDNPTPHVFITSSDMLGKAGWWSYFGSWNFNNNTGQNYVYSAAAANTTQVNGTTVIQGQNNVVVQINGTQISAGLLYLNSNNETQVITPHKLTVIQGNTTAMDQVVNNDSPISILLIAQNNTYVTVVMNKELESSMFTRLFLMGGNGLTRFKLASQKSGVMVWNVN